MSARPPRAAHLVVLDLVEHAVATAAWSLMDDFPALQGEPHPWKAESPEERAARGLLRALRAFVRALRRYQRAVVAPGEGAALCATRDDTDF